MTTSLSRLSGIRSFSRDGVKVFLNTDALPDPDPDPFFRIPEIVESLPGGSSRAAGRQSVWTWHPNGLPEPGLMVRQYVHGGLLGPLFGAWFFGTGRMESEMAVHLHALRHDVPTCRPVALRTERASRLLHTGFYVTEAIPDSANLLELCAEVDREERRRSPIWKRRLAERIADAVAAMHDAGIEHADLNLKNLLVKRTGEHPDVYIIDFDRAELREEVSLRKRLKNLVRLDRSIVKWGSSRRTISLWDRLRVWRYYLERYPDWKPRWKELVRRHSTWHLRHALSRK